jgi:hypothetical protein
LALSARHLNEGFFGNAKASAGAGGAGLVDRHDQSAQAGELRLTREDSESPNQIFAFQVRRYLSSDGYKLNIAEKQFILMFEKTLPQYTS